MEDLAATLRAHFDPLQAAAFFGALIVLGLLEPITALASEATGRSARWPANFGLTAINLVVLRAMPVGSLAVADLAAARGWGLLNQIAVHFPNRMDFSWLEVLDLFQRHPELAEINAQVQHKNYRQTDSRA